MEKVLDLFSLKGKVIVATGATGYLCRHFLEAAAQAGGDIAALDMPGTENKLEELTQHLTEVYQIRAKWYEVNVTDEAHMMQVRDSVAADFGHVDGLIACAGINHHGSIEEYSFEDFNSVMTTNVTGTFLSDKLYGELMVKQGGGSIINMGSASGLVVSRYPRLMTAYSACKGGIHHLTHSVAAEWAGAGVRCNCLTPGYMEHGMTHIRGHVRRSDDPKYQRELMESVPMERFGVPKDLTGAVIYLLSDASGYTTGLDFKIDGGLTLW